MRRLCAILTGILLMIPLAQAQSTPAPTEAASQGLTFIKVEVLPDGTIALEDAPADQVRIRKGKVTTYNPDWIKGLAQGYGDPEAVLQDILTGIFMTNILWSIAKTGEADVPFDDIKRGFSYGDFDYPITLEAWRDGELGESGLTWVVNISPYVHVKLYSQGVKSEDSPAEAVRKHKLVARGEMEIMNAEGEREEYLSIAFPIQSAQASAG